MNCPVKVSQINNSVKILDQTFMIYRINEKKTNSSDDKSHKFPEIVLKLHHLITLEIDIFFLNNLPFLRQCHDI